MEPGGNKKQILKDIILKLHHGLTVEQAKERFEKEVGEITSLEIAELEQALINEGLSPDEIKKFCNVHALLFQSSLAKELVREESASHPISLFKDENREIEKILQAVKNNPPPIELRDLLVKLKGIELHYTRKEQLVFPYLEKAGFFGPSKVMWGKDNEIRGLLKAAMVDPSENKVKALIEEVEGMIFKEENILFPTCLEKLCAEDWIAILKESEEIGYVFIEKPKETSSLIAEFKVALAEEPKLGEGENIFFPSGEFSLKELMCLFNTLPFDVTFVDKEDRVRYFSEGKNRIFVRTRSIIGRKVQNCHPPQSLEKVEEILNSFKEGKKDAAEFWINFGGKLVYIRYFAVRDNNRNYMGTLEVTQDITGIKKLEGERRLLNEKT